MKRRLRKACSFTLVELMVVISVIALLAGILLAAVGGVRNQAARSQAKTEISALEAALTRFQMDNGDFPGSTNANPATIQTSSIYQAGSQILFTNLMQRTVFTNTNAAGIKAYLDPKLGMVVTNASPNYFVDPWGYPYGYNWDTNRMTSPFGKSSPDIWSTGGQTGIGTQTNRAKWICSWIN